MNWLLFISLSIIMILSPYYRGLYFSADLYLPALLLNGIFLLALVWYEWKKEWVMIKSVTPILLLPLIYFISAFGAENPQGAWNSYIKWTFYAVFFLLILKTSSRNKINPLLPLILQVTGIVLALIPILHHFGIWEFRSSIVTGRFAGAFQYPNTFGMVMGAFLLFSLIMLSKNNSSVTENIFYSVPVIFLFLGFLQSYSRAMFLILPIIWFSGLLLLKGQNQIRYVFFTLFSTVLTLFAFQNLMLQVLIPVVFIFVLCAIFFNLGCCKLRWEINFNRLMLPLIIAMIGILALLDLINEGLIFRQLPAQLQDRISSIQLSSPTAQERFTFFVDGLKISKDYLLLGTGGEGWSSVYKKYQSLPYLSNKAHNGFLEVLIDTGVIGFTIFIGVLGWLTAMVVKEFKNNRENILQTAVLMSLSVIFAHSLIDFNFSYGTVWLIILWLFATGIKQPINTFEGNTKKINKWAILAITCAIILTASVLSYRFLKAERLYKLSSQSNSALMKEILLAQAITLNPYNEKYLLKSSELGKDSELESVASALTALEPNNPSMYLKAGDLAAKSGNTVKAIDYYQKGMKADPYSRDLYEKSIKSKVEYAIVLLKKKQIETADMLLESAANDFEINMKWLEYFNEQVTTDRDRYNSRDFEITSQAEYYTTLAYFLQGKYEESAAMYNPMANRTTEKENIAALAALSFEKLGQVRKADLIIHTHQEHNSSFIENIEYFKRNLSY